jgi:hypothetical protein
LLIVDDFLPVSQHRALLDAVEQIVTAVGPEPPMPSPGPAADRGSTGFEADLHEQWAGIAEQLASLAAAVRRHLELPHFRLSGIGYQLTVHRDDAMFHTPPMGAPAAGTRRVEFTYTFAPDPGAFTGGALRLYETIDKDGFPAAGERFEAIEPTDNRIVFFPSDRHHEVGTMRPTSDGGATRYTLDGWFCGDPIQARRPAVTPATMQILQQRYIPRLSESGYVVRPTPQPVHELLRSLLTIRGGRRRAEHADPVFVHGGDPEFVEVGDLGDDIVGHLLPIHEEFAGVELEPSQIYGLRSYGDGQSLVMHVDRPATHIVSSVIQVAQDVDEPWPLQVDLDGRRYEVVLNPGQMLLYEGAACAHGRITPMRGRAYVNLFVHYRPKDWPWSVESLVDAGLRDGLIDGSGHVVGA